VPVEDLRQSPMMAHMLDALDNGEDIGHYGRLVFAMIGRHFVSNDELVGLLTKDHDAGEQEIKALVVRSVGLRGRIRRLEREAWGEVAAIRQPDGLVERFPEGELASAFLDAIDWAMGRKSPEEPVHPLCAAARNSSDPAWRELSYAAGGQDQAEAVEDLSEWLSPQHPPTPGVPPLLLLGTS
jgi:hypothetical protein